MSQQINLFNPQFEPQKHQLSARIASQALGVLAVALLGLNFYGQRQISTLQRDDDAAKAQLTQREALRDKTLQAFPSRKKDPTLEQQIATAETQRQSLRHASEVLRGGELGNTQGYAGIFRALAQARVEGVWLTGVRVSGQQIGLEGRTLQAALVPVLITRLGQQDLLKGKTFASLEIGTPQVASTGTEAQAAAPKPNYLSFSLQSVNTAASTPATAQGGPR